MEYKFSVKPFKKAQFRFHIWTAAITILSFGTIYAGWYDWVGDPNDPVRIYGTVLMAVPLLGYLFPWYTWFAGKFAFSEMGIHHKIFLFREVVIPWDSVYHVQRRNMGFSRSETIDVICFELAPDMVCKKDEYSSEFYFYHQRKYFVIMYSEERMLQVQSYFKK